MSDAPPPPKLNRRQFLWTAGLTGTALAASACAAPAPAGSPAAGAPGTAGAVSPVAGATSAAVRKPSGTLIVGLPSFPTSLDPNLGSTATVLRGVAPVCDGLTKLGPTYALEPALATAWRNVEPTLWEFDLRPNVRFSNGEAFDAESVRFTIERIITPENRSPNAAQLTSVAGVEAVSASKVRIRTKTPNPILPRVLSAIYMLPPQAFGRAGDAAFIAQPIGTGPFRVDEYVPNTQIVYSAWDGSWRGVPSIQGLRFQLLAENAARLAALQSGQIDIAQGLPIQLAASFGADIRLEKALGGGMPNIALRTDSGPTADQRVREAINLAVDKDAIVKNILGDAAVVAQGQFIGSDCLGFDPALRPFPYDPARARQLLTQAGYPNGLSLELQAQASDRDAIEAMIGSMTPAGITLEVRFIESALWRERYFSGPRPPLFYEQFSYDPLYDASFVYQQFKTTSLPGTNHWSSPEWDRLLALGEAEFDTEKRAGYFQQMGRLIRQEAGIVFLWQPEVLYAVRKNIEWKPGPGAAMVFDKTVKS